MADPRTIDLLSPEVTREADDAEDRIASIQPGGPRLFPESFAAGGNVMALASKLETRSR